MRILLADDDTVISKVFTVMLQRARFGVAVAEDGLMGVEMWECGSFDLVLMEAQMPHMSNRRRYRF